MKAMILAAGEGTRLKPLTLETPKVLLPIEGVTLIEHILAWLKNHGIFEVAVNLHHSGDKVKSFLGDGSHFGMRFYYSVEETLLGTAGGVRRIRHFFDDTFVVVYGDILTDLNLSTMVNYHKAKKSLATIAIVEVPAPWEVGIVSINKEGRILSFVEKPPRDRIVNNLSSCGIYIFEKDIHNHISGKNPTDFAYDVFPQLLRLGAPIYGYHLKPEDYFIDIGTLEKYQRVLEDVAAGKMKLKR